MNTLSPLRKKLFGDREFYKLVLAISVPIIIQNAITNFVSLLDNIMVGAVGTEQMTGVSVGNQLLFIFNLCVFGGMAGAGIFCTQFHGAGNTKGVRNCFRFKLHLGVLLVVTALLVFSFAGDHLILLFLNENDPGRVAATLEYGMSYLRMMLWGLVPFALSQIYSGTLRETGETGLPMRASIIAVFSNLVLNYVLIFGHFGFQAMGVRGAALATVISRYIELGVIVCCTHANVNKYRFIEGAYRSLKVPLALTKNIIVRGMPLLMNEALWSTGMAMLTRCYSLRGLDVVAAMNISNTVANLFNVVVLSMGASTAIIVGQALGANEIERAKELVWKLILFSLMCCVGTGILLAAASPFIPMIYNTTDAIRSLATRLMLVCVCCMPLLSMANSSYFIMRSGGKTMVTFAFDSLYTWSISIPIAWCLVNYTGLPVVTIYFCVQFADILKCLVCYILIKKGIWINSIVVD